MSNNIQIEGNLGKDAQVGFTKKGNPYALFGIGDTPKSKDGSKPETTWWNCAWWDADGKVADQLRKGTRVRIEGWAFTEKWLDKKDGTEKKGLKINVQKLEVMERKEAKSDEQPF